MRSIPFILLLSALTGCASYEYDVKSPPQLAMHVGTKDDAVFARDPLEYRLRTVDSRLVVRIYNQTDDSISLIGERSFVVDPAGQSHPLQSQTMAPKSFIKLILPPIRPQLEPTGPTIGIGVGTVFGSASRRGDEWAGYDDNFYGDPPRYLVDDGNAIYWNWDGETDARLSLVFQQGDKIFTQDFIFARHKH